jgi:hypothetical protein
MEINKCNIEHKQSKDKNHTIVTISTEEAFDKIQYSFMIKAQIKIGIEVMYFNIIEAIHNKIVANSLLNGKKT